MIMRPVMLFVMIAVGEILSTAALAQPPSAYGGDARKLCFAAARRIKCCLQRLLSFSTEGQIPNGQYDGGTRASGYESEGAYWQTASRFDSEGPKPTPRACLACHGGSYNPVKKVVSGETFLPINPSNLLFSQSVPGAARPAQTGILANELSSYGNMQQNKALLYSVVCQQRSMPHSETSFRRFWTEGGAVFLRGYLALSLGYASCP
jgi:hypothetical protein